MERSVFCTGLHALIEADTIEATRMDREWGQHIAGGSLQLFFWLISVACLTGACMADRSLICQQPVTPPRPRVLPRASTANFSLLLAKHTHTHTSACWREKERETDLLSEPCLCGRMFMCISQDVCAWRLDSLLGALLPPLAHLFKVLVWVLAMLKCLAGWARADMEREQRACTRSIWLAETLFCATLQGNAF